MTLATTAIPVQPARRSTEGVGAPMVRHRWKALGTVCELQFVCEEPERARSFIAAAEGWVEAFEAKYSRFRPTSLLSRVNAAAGIETVEVDAEMDQMLEICGSIHFMTRGVLDVTALPLLRLWDFRSPTPRVPEPSEILSASRLVGWNKVQREPGRVFLPHKGMALDFGGWGKEYAVDAVAEIAKQHGLNDVLVDFGHDLRALGAPTAKPAWHVGLEDVNKPGTYRGSIGLRDRGVACSGDYIRNFSIGGRRYGHIIDPRTGWPVSNGCLQVTIVASNCLFAGVLSTAVFILGPTEGIKLVQEQLGAEGLILTERARHQTRGFFQYVVEN